jgi:hypothetical protein
LLPASISDCRRASPSAVSAVSEAEKKADAAIAAATAIHCQVGIKARRF